MNLNPAESNKFSLPVSQNQMMLQDETIQEQPLTYKEYLPPFQPEKISLSRLIDPSLAKAIQCPICFNVFDQPVSLNCGHTYCLKCLKNPSNTSNCCPECRSSLPRLETLKKNIALAYMIDDQAVSCPSHKYDTQRTCQAGVKIKDLEKHWTACLHMLFKCSCGKLISSSSFLEPDQKCKCPDIKCKYCSSVYQERLINYHSDDCKRKGIKCKYCGSVYDLKDEETHRMSDCFSFCPYKDVGCTLKTKMSPEILRAHSEDQKNVHNSLLLHALNYKIAYEFLSKTSEFNEMIPNSSETNPINFDYGGKGLKLFYRPRTSVKGVIQHVTRYFNLNKPGYSVEIRLQDTEKTSFLKKDKLFADYHFKFDQTYDVCLVKTSDNSDEDEFAE